MLELAYVVAAVELEGTVEVKGSVERGVKTLLELDLVLELELELEAAVVEGELMALRGMVAMIFGMGCMAKMSLEFLQQARLPGPLPWVSQQLYRDIRILCTLLYRWRTYY